MSVLLLPRQPALLCKRQADSVPGMGDAFPSSSDGNCSSAEPGTGSCQLTFHLEVLADFKAQQRQIVGR